MSVMISDDKKELIVTCGCGCDEAIHFQIAPFDDDNDDYAFITYMNSNFYRDQGQSIINIIRMKLSKIWSIIRNKDYTYSDLLLSKKEFNKFKEYINSYGDANMAQVSNIMRTELMKHGDLYDGFLASISSALGEVNIDTNSYNRIAKVILNRIIGE